MSMAKRRRSNEPESINNECNSDSDLCQDQNQIKQDKPVSTITSVNDIINDIKETLSCCACLNFKGNLNECLNGHLICFNCYHTLRRQYERPTCPFCRVHLTTQEAKKSLVAQRVLAELPQTCEDCGASLRGRYLPSHRLTECSMRKIDCEFKFLGCDWNGIARDYELSHKDNCVAKSRYNTQPELLDEMRKVIYEHDQNERINLHSSISTLKMLEAHEIQMVDCNLYYSYTEDDLIHYTSGSFYANQSRWSLEITLSSSPLQGRVNQTSAPEHEVWQTIASDLSTVEMRNSEQPSVFVEENNDPFGNVYEELVTTTGPHKCTELNYASLRVIKESNPGIGRKCFSFVLMAIEIPSKFMKVYARSHLNTAKFLSRGSQSEFNNISLLKSYSTNGQRIEHSRLLNESVIKAEILFARKTTEDVY